MRRYGGFLAAAILVWFSVACLFNDAEADFRRGSRYALMGSGTSIGVPETISGLHSWWDLSDTSSVTGTTEITQINDLSGNSNNLTLLDGNNGPDYTAVTQNSLNCADFDHLNTEYISNNAFHSAPASYTMLWVARVNSDTGVPMSSRSSVAGTGGSGTRWDWRMAAGNRQLKFFVNSAEQTVATMGDDTSFHIHTVSLPSSGVARTWIDGVVEDGTSTARIPNPFTDINIGVFHDETLPGDFTICEVIVYDSRLADTDRRTLEAYLQAKWNTAAISYSDGLLTESNGWLLLESGEKILLE